MEDPTISILIDIQAKHIQSPMCVQNENQGQHHFERFKLKTKHIVIYNMSNYKYKNIFVLSVVLLQLKSFFIPIVFWITSPGRILE